MGLWRWWRRWSWLQGAIFTVAVAGTVLLTVTSAADSSRAAARLGLLRADAERIHGIVRANDTPLLLPAIELWRTHFLDSSGDLREALGETRALTLETAILSAFTSLETNVDAGRTWTTEADTELVIQEVNHAIEQLSSHSEAENERARLAAVLGIAVSMLAAALGLWGALNRNQRVRQVQQREARLHARYENLIEHSPTVFVSTDAHGIVTTVNASEENSAIRAWVGHPVSDILDEDSEALESLARTVSDGRPRGRQVEHRGRVYRLDWQLNDGNDGPAGLDIVVSDVTDRIQFDDQLRSAFDGVIGVITKLTDLTDPYTQGHEETVANIAEAIALRLDWGSRAVEGLRVAARLHDTGKIAIPAELLARPGTLHPVELELIKLHVEHARRIFRGIRFPWPEIRAVYEHHERLDGSGYPLGLSGDEISQAGRILAVADVCDAMTSHRPYRPARSRYELIDELRAGQHRRYDAKVVDVAASLIESGEMPFRQSLGSDRHGEVLPDMADSPRRAS